MKLHNKNINGKEKLLALLAVKKEWKIPNYFIRIF